MASAKELRDKTPEELKQHEAEVRKSLFEARYKHAQRQLVNTAQLRSQRRELARIQAIKTELAAKDAGKKTEKA